MHVKCLAVQLIGFFVDHFPLGATLILMTLFDALKSTGEFLPIVVSFNSNTSRFYNRVVIMSNVYPPAGNLLLDYINIGPRSSLPLEMSSKVIAVIPLTNAPQYIERIKQNLTISRNLLVEPECDKNNNDWAAAQALGVQFTAVNFWSEDEQLASYLKKENFGRSSFKIKPLPIRYIIEYIAPPLLPNPELNARDGKPIAPPNIIMPS